MHNPVPETITARLALTAIAAILVAGSNSSCAQTTLELGHPIEHEQDWFPGLVAQGSLGHRLEIVVPPLISDQVAAARLSQNGRTWRVDETNCEPFKAALLAFRRLPSLRPGSYRLQPDVSGPLPMAPSRPHGEIWTISTVAFTPDWSSVDLEMRGNQGPYAFWTSDTVEAIKACEQD